MKACDTKSGDSRATPVSETIQTVLSLFPGVGLLDRAFEEREEFSVVRGPDLIHGGDIRNFRVAAGVYGGIIAGPPCQGFSQANAHRFNPQHPSVRNSVEMLELTVRLIEAARPTWFLIENVPNVPDVRVGPYIVQRIAINDWECGGLQLRWRAIQFGHIEGWHLRPSRVNDRSFSRKKGRRPEAITTKPTSRHMTFAEQCRRQGLSEPVSLPGWTREAKFRAVGNGVPLSVGRVLAAAVAECVSPANENDCLCGCGRSVSGPRQRSATAACRKRLQMRREAAAKFGSPNHDFAEMADQRSSI
ncbi:MAG: DNA cytosine methyltransferase [Planctomyces sp.]|nr:DNA cytosine methyltransferase [Planctomyces sp.]